MLTMVNPPAPEPNGIDIESVALPLMAGAKGPPALFVYLPTPGLLNPEVAEEPSMYAFPFGSVTVAWLICQ